MSDRNNTVAFLSVMKSYPSLLVSGVASGALKEVLELQRQNEIMMDALNKIAAWSEGFDVDCSFDEPGAARIARRALIACEEIPE